MAGLYCYHMTAGDTHAIVSLASTGKGSVSSRDKFIFHRTYQLVNPSGDKLICLAFPDGSVARFCLPVMQGIEARGTLPALKSFQLCVNMAFRELDGI